MPDFSWFKYSNENGTFSLFFISARMSTLFPWKGAFQKQSVQCISQLLYFWTETRSSFGNYVVYHGLVPTLTIPTLFRWHTIHLCLLIREKDIWLAKSFIKYALFPLVPHFSRQGGLTPGVTINMWPPEKHSLTSSDHKPKGMLGRLFMNEACNWLPQDPVRILRNRFWFESLALIYRLCNDHSFHNNLCK